MNAIAAPIVSSDSTSPEAILARNAKKVEAQSYADSAYDDKDITTESFANYGNHRSRDLAYGIVASAAFLSLFVFLTRK